MKRLLNINNEFWTHERSLTALLVYLGLALFIWMPLASYRLWGFLISDLLFNLILLSGIFAVLTRRKKQVLLITLAVMSSSIRIVYFFVENWWIELMSYFITILFLVLLTGMVLQHIFKDGPVNFYRIQGSIVVYMIIGIIWAFLYATVDLLSPGSFVLTATPKDSPDIFSQFLYFSFVTMTTLGSGDMVPVLPLTKSLVIFQGMIGMLYPVIMIARLVSLEVDHSRSSRKMSN